MGDLILKLWSDENVFNLFKQNVIFQNAKFQKYSVAYIFWMWNTLYVKNIKTFYVSLLLCWWSIFHTAFMVFSRLREKQRFKQMLRKCVLSLETHISVLLYYPKCNSCVTVRLFFLQNIITSSYIRKTRTFSSASPHYIYITEINQTLKSKWGML